MGAQPNRLWPLTLFGVALATRLAFVLWFGPNGLAISSDARSYHDLAINLVEQGRFVTDMDPPHRTDIPYATRPPLTPFVLALAYFVFGPSLFVGQLLFAAIGAASVSVLYFLGKELFSFRVALFAGILATFYPFFVFLSAVPLTENLSLLFYTYLGFSLVRLARERSFFWAGLSGLPLGLAALNRPQILGLLALLPLWAWIVLKEESVKKRLKILAFIFGVSILLIIPWTIRNYLLFRHWIPISLQLGSVLYQGNNPFAGEALAGLRNGAIGWYNNPRSGDKLAGLPPVEADRAALHLGLAFIWENPGIFVRYALQKLLIFGSAYDHWVHKVSWYLLLALSLPGFWLSVRRWRELLPLHIIIFETALIAMVFTSMPRFRAPVEPFFMLMGALALERIGLRFVRRQSYSRSVWTSWFS